MTKPLEVRQKLRVVLERAEQIGEKFNRSQRFYLVGVFFGILSAFWYFTPFTDIFRAAFFASVSLFILGMISDLLVIYKVVWETAIGKGTLLLLYALSTNVAYAAASRIVNELVKFDTSSLTYTVNLVAILLAPVFILIGIYVVVGAILAVAQFYLMITLYSDQLRKSKFLSSLLPQPTENYPGVTFVVRLFTFPAMLLLLWSYGGRLAPGYGTFIEKTAMAFMFNFEAAHYSRCDVNKSSRVIKVTDEEIIVISPDGDGYKFEPMKCIPLLKP